MAERRCKPFETPIHSLQFGVHPLTIDYDRLEERRVRRLGLQWRYARMSDVRRYYPLPPEAPYPERLCRRVPVLPTRWINRYAIRAGVASGNTIEPFSTMQLVYWSPFLSEYADFRKRKTGVRI